MKFGLSVATVLLLFQECRFCATGFLLPPSGNNQGGFHRFSNGLFGRSDDGMGPPGIPSDHHHHLFDGEDNQPLSRLWAQNNKFQNETEVPAAEMIRGGSSKKKKKDESLVKGARTTLSNTAEYWRSVIVSSSNAVWTPVRATKKKVSSVLFRRSKEQKLEDELLDKLRTMPVRTVSIPNSTVVPRDVVHLAAKRAGLIGSPLRTDRIQAFAETLKGWYNRKGYVLNRVVGATLDANTATAEIQVQEPSVAPQPVSIIVYKEMVVDDEGRLTTFRKYKEKHRKRRTFGHDKITKADVNTTLVETQGRIDPHRISKALGMQPAKPFRWYPDKWERVSGSGLFGRIFRASPEPLTDGTVQLQILATEAPLRHLEYGVSKSLYTGSWEGEIDFEHGNLLGGGETLGLVVRRGTKDAEPSVRVSYGDKKFGGTGAYEVSLFSEAIGNNNKDVDDLEEGDDTSDTTQEEKSNRRGVSVNLRKPFDSRFLQTTSVSFSGERASISPGSREDIASGTLNVGPFVKDLPFEARSNFDCSVTTGCRVHNDEGFSLFPFTSTTVTTKQVLPLARKKKSPILAFRHSFTTSTKNLPSHEANALGFASSIRGTEANGPISTSVVGTTELRFPVRIESKRINQSGSIVLFGDWVYGRKEQRASTFSKKAVGVGFRKDFQGLPLKLDVTYSTDKKIKSSFGLGKDFDV